MFREIYVINERVWDAEMPVGGKRLMLPTTFLALDNDRKKCDTILHGIRKRPDKIGYVICNRRTFFSTYFDV